MSSWYILTKTRCQEKLKSPRGAVGEFCDFKHFTLLRVWDCYLIPGITIKILWREHASEGAVWKKLSLWKQKRRKDKVQRGNPLFKCQAVGAILSPALISSFLRPSGLDSSPSSLPPGLLCVCASGPDWTLARLRLTFTILGLDKWHILVLHHRKGSRMHVGQKVKPDTNVNSNCLQFVSHVIWALWLHSTILSVQVPVSLFLCLQVSFRFLFIYSISTFAFILCTKPVCHGTVIMKWTSS